MSHFALRRIKKLWKNRQRMANLISSLFVLALLAGYSLLLLALVGWVLHGWLRERIKKRTLVDASARYRFLRLLLRN